MGEVLRGEDEADFACFVGELDSEGESIGVGESGAGMEIPPEVKSALRGGRSLVRGRALVFLSLRLEVSSESS